ncbi:MAG: heparan-alpha-glucosaminide N-acetyltransferase domain-containing protein [Bacteroidota bacterium]
MKERDLSIDFLRGLAIFTMIAANMAAYNYNEPHDFLFRLYGSFAAPTFIFISGLLIPLNLLKSKRPFHYFFQRGTLTILVAAILDVFAWHVLPFSSFDVLYVIGLSIILNYIIFQINLWFHLSIALIFILVSPIAQNIFGYNNSPFEIMISDDNLLQTWIEGPFIRNFLIEGWFPIFPWLGISFMGSFCGRFFYKSGAKNRERLFSYFGGILLTIGGSFWLLTNPKLITRSGYSELFYPPTLPYLITYLGLILFILGSHKFLLPKFMKQILAVFGQSSLLMYILHSFLIAYFFSVNFEPCSFIKFIQLYLVHAFILWWIAKFIQAMRPNLKNYPFIIRYLTGT